jgi:hypothetical protein
MLTDRLALRNSCKELASKLLAERDPNKSHKLADELRAVIKELNALTHRHEN